MQKYDVAAYVWPAYTGDELRTRMFWPEGMGEWETVRAAYPKFEGHQWPRKPLWGYVNEADPAVMEMEITQAVRHGVNVFIYDWYWYDRRPFLEGCLNDGFLKAANNKDMKFYLMWANHNVNHLWNRHLSTGDCAGTVIWDAAVNRQEFEEMATRLVDKYFHYDNYYRINGEPVFMIYDIPNFMKGMGGVDAAAEAIAWFRQLVVSKGYPGVHIQYNVRGGDAIKVVGADGLSSEPLGSYKDMLKQLDADSCTNYQYVMITADVIGERGEYLSVLERIQQEYDRVAAECDTPYFPHVSCGWDNNPRYKEFRPKILFNNTPENFEKALRMAKAHIDKHDLPAPLITVNSWNEWTESSYLQPDDLYGYGYLEAVKRVFVDEE